MSKESKYGEASKYLSLLMRLGIEICLSILICFAIGLYLDKKFQSNGLILVPSVIIGVIGGFYCLYKEMKNLEKLDL